MTTREKLLLGGLAGMGLAWGARQVLRARRRITLDDRVVVITGASSGLGLIAARMAAERGARLVIAARTGDDLDAAADDLRAAGARDVLPVPTDVADPAQCRRLIDRAMGRHGRIDVLINNAGTIQVGPVRAMTADDYEMILRVNFYGALHTTLAAVPHMRARGFGRVGNVVSVGGKVAVPHLVPYSASKFALTGLTKGLRAELAPDGILVTGIYPATIRTGAHGHALIKGDHGAEYTLFALGDTVPGLAASAFGAARALWRGVCDGDPEVHVGWQAHVLPRLDALFPNLTAEGSALVAALLPDAEGPSPAIRGEDVRGRIPEALTRLVPEGARPLPAGDPTG